MDRLNRMKWTANAPTMSTDAPTLFVIIYAPSSNPPTQLLITVISTNLLTATTTAILDTNHPMIIKVLSTDVPTYSNDPLWSMAPSTVIPYTPMTQIPNQTPARNPTTQTPIISPTKIYFFFKHYIDGKSLYDCNLFDLFPFPFKIKTKRLEWANHFSFFTVNQNETEIFWMFFFSINLFAGLMSFNPSLVMSYFQLEWLWWVCDARAKNTFPLHRGSLPNLPLLGPVQFHRFGNLANDMLFVFVFFFVIVVHKTSFYLLAALDFILSIHTHLAQIKEEGVTR